MTRLGLAVVATLAPMAAAAAEDWQPQRSLDPMTDQETVRLSGSAEDGNGVLTLSCKGDDFSMLVIVDDVPTIDNMVNSGRGAAIKGRWRIDSDKPDGITFWAPRSNLHALEPHSNFSKDAKKFLRKLEGRQRVTFEVAGVPGVVAFNLTGLETSNLAACYKP
jgi:hypothetical protein